ncbi:Na+/H+ antiporter subunit E [Microvirga makkahensis]|uniref:Na+/H+ antiporter subunit E n=1 Tax=Microvirga makkahensis TaxID=1128670 RepID=A0A7X3MWU8_9HYPH|nr:Na+/H+ antiporter subunit E [Microvirga makkahensis]MXQ14664.1 Na+/H+ antiporter subunit E [Microvirga makkahensis]
MARLFPQPILSIVITLVWVLLANDISAGTVVLGIILGWAIPRLTSRYWPDRPRIRQPFTVLEYLGIVLKDIAVSNVQVAYWVLFRRGDTLRSQYITVPLDLTTAEAVTVLAGTITLTPGTVSADLSADGRSLLVHCLETHDPAATVAQIKERYERRLKEIFE